MRVIQNLRFYYIVTARPNKKIFLKNDDTEWLIGFRILGLFPRAAGLNA